MIAKKRTEILFMTLTMIFFLVGSALAEGEWATNGADIHSTNSGNVGIGITNPQAKQHNQIEARSTAFDAGDGVTWHDLVIQNPDNTRSAAVELAFELNRTYYTNAGTGIAAVKSTKSEDYGADMIFVTRPHRAVAKERGLVMSEILAKQMQKIEELTLYLINIKQENNDLKAKLESQNKKLSALKELRKRIEALELKN